MIGGLDPELKLDTVQYPEWGMSAALPNTPLVEKVVPPHSIWLPPRYPRGYRSGESRWLGHAAFPSMTHPWLIFHCLYTQTHKEFLPMRPKHHPWISSSAYTLWGREVEPGMVILPTAGNRQFIPNE